jgi:sec-independent protein translocase protein TatA
MPFGMGMQEMIIIGIIAVLLFGKRLPEVAKSVGKSYHEFRRGLTDIQSNVQSATSSIYEADTQSSSATAADSVDEYDDFDEVSAPKFQPPPSEPDTKPVVSERPERVVDEK